jgi:hypothetical protein
MVKVKCVICGKEFEAKRRSAKYCPECKKKVRTMSTKSSHEMQPAKLKKKMSLLHTELGKERVATAMTVEEAESTFFSVVTDPNEELKGMSDAYAKKAGFIGKADMIVAYDDKGEAIHEKVNFDIRNQPPQKLVFNQQTGEYDLVPDYDLPRLEQSYMPEAATPGIGTVPPKSVKPKKKSVISMRIKKPKKPQKPKTEEEIWYETIYRKPMPKPKKPKIVKGLKIDVDSSYIGRRLTPGEYAAIQDEVKKFEKTKKDYDKVITNTMIVHIARRGKKADVRVFGR